jgi:vitamin B12 transporter
MSRRRFFPRLGALILAVFFCGRSVLAQTLPMEPAPIVTVATRLPESSQTIGTDTDAISGLDLERQQMSGFSDALAEITAAPLLAAGQAGAPASLFLRGSDPNQTLFLVDGIRLNDANTDYGPFLGGARIFPGDTLEVALGPQSALYGSEAAGGVVSLAARKGTGSFSGSVSAEVGSFGTLDGTIVAQGAGGGWAYNLAAAASHTNNDRVNNAFDSTNLSLRLDKKLGTYLDAGVTLRSFVSSYGNPGNEFTNDPYAYQTEQNLLGSIFFDAQLTDYITSHLILGGQESRFDSFDTTAAGPPVEPEVRTQRGVIDWQNTLQLTADNRLIAGLTYDDETNVNTNFSGIIYHQTSLGLYAEDEWTLFNQLHLTGGLRNDSFDTFGDASTGRATAAWLTTDHMLKLRGSYGTGFDAPNFQDLYAQEGFFIGNPNLRPERSRGWDAGLDFYPPDSRDVVSATYFETNFDDLIAENLNVFPFTTANIGRARTHGVELAVQTTLAAVIRTKISYTRLETENLVQGMPLPLRPHYNAAADFWWDGGKGISAGVGIDWVGTRADVDAQTFATINDPGYTVARIYAAWQISARFGIKVRVENLLDRKYEPVNGYPALGRALFGGGEFKF